MHADAGRFAYDTMTLVGPGTWEAARAAADCALDGRRAGERRRARWPTRCAGRRATTRRRPASAAPATSTTRPSRPRRCVEAAPRGSGSSTSTPTTATAPRRSSTTAPTCSTGRCTSTRAPAGSRTSSGYADETGAGRRRREPPATSRCPEGTGDEPLAGGGGATSRSGSSAACDALVVSLGVDAAARRPREPAAGHRGRLPAGRRLLGATGLPAVVVQEGGYHLPTLGGLVAAYLAGHTGLSTSTHATLTMD